MYFLCLRHGLKPRDEWTVPLQAHLDWMREMHLAGKVLMSGPSRERKLGIYVIRADTKPEAEAIAETDPFTAGGECGFEVFDWEIHQIAGIGHWTDPDLPPKQ